jgi:beta-glucosidase
MAKRTYRYFQGEPLYPFGYGLSYTSFTYANTKPNSAAVAADGALEVSADVTNSGKMAGEEVVQLYLTHDGVAGTPLRALEGFQHVQLAPGESRTVTFRLTNRQLGIVDESGKHRVMPGTVKVWVGGGQPATRAGLPKTAGAETQFTITGEAALPE